MEITDALRHDLDMANWVTPTEMPPIHGTDTREWDVIIRMWGDGIVATTVGPFATWDDALEWVAGPALWDRCTVIGIAEHRRPKGDWIADRRRPRKGTT